MRQQVSNSLVGFALLVVGCQGKLIEPNIPGQQNPPPAGTPALALRIGGTGVDLILDVATDAQGNAYVAGTFTGSVDFDPSATVNALTSLGGTDVFLAKYTAAGALAWVSRIGGAGTESVTALARDGSGNLYLGGGFEGSASFSAGAGAVVLNSQGAEDGFVAKFTADGGLAWARRFGGLANDGVADVAVDGAGNAYAAGSFSGTANALPAPGPSILSDGSAQDGFVLSLDPSGAVRWALPVGGTQDDATTALAATSAGTVTVSGSFRGSADFARNAAPVRLTSQGGADLFLASYTSAGTLVWARDIGGPNDDAITPGALALDGAGGATISGAFSGSMDFDPGPATATRTSQGSSDLFVARYDAGGIFSTVATLGGVGTISGVHIAVDGNGDLLLTGAFSGAVDFDPGPGTRVLSSLGTGGATDAFVVKLSPVLGLLWVSRFGESTSDASRQNAGVAVATDPQGDVFVAGHFFGSPDFDPGSAAFRLTSLGDADGFLVLLTAAGTLALLP